MGHPDFRVAGRIFASLSKDGAHGGVKLTPDEQARLMAEHPRAFAAESGAWGRQGWTRVRLGVANEEALGEAMTLAWRNVQRVRPAPEAARRPRTPVSRRGTK